MWTAKKYKGVVLRIDVDFLTGTKCLGIALSIGDLWPVKKCLNIVLRWN